MGFSANVGVGDTPQTATTNRAPAVSDNSQKELLSANWEKGPTFSAKLYRSASIEKDIKNNLGTNKGKFNLNQSRKIILT